MLQDWQRFGHVPDAPRCGCADVLPLGAQPLRWRKTSLTWRVATYLPAALIAQAVQDDVFAAAFADWASRIEIDFRRVAMGAQADITLFSRRIDGPGRILAQAQLPNGSDSPLWLQFDDSETAWAVLEGSREANLHNVAKHEIGHLIGLQHDPAPAALMYAMANSSITRVTDLDVAAALRLGYAKRTSPPPPSPTPAANRLTLEWDGPATNFRIVDS